MRHFIKMTKNYTILSNQIIQHESISLDAKAIYFYMASLPDNWDFSVERIAYCLNITEARSRKYINELIDFGLLQRVFYHNSMGNRKSIYILYDLETMKNKFTDKEAIEFFHNLGNPTLGNRKVGYIYNKVIKNKSNKQNIEFEKKVSNETYFSHSLVRNDISHDCVGEQSQDITPLLEATNQAQTTSQDESAKETKRGRQGSDSLFEAMPNPKRKQYQAEFEEFWKMYPKKEEKGKAYALYLQKVPKIISHEELCNRLSQQRKVWEAKRTQIQYIPQCQKWLRNDTFKDNFDEILESYRQDSYRAPNQQVSSEASRMSEIDKKIEAGRFTRDMEQEHIELYGRGAIDFDEYMRIFEENERRKKEQRLN